MSNSLSDFAVGDLVKSRDHFQLYSTIWRRSPDGDVFKPEGGPNIWFLGQGGIIIEIFELPFRNKKICRILMNSGGIGWVWQENICSLAKSNSAIA